FTDKTGSVADGISGLKIVRDRSDGFTFSFTVQNRLLVAVADSTIAVGLTLGPTTVSTVGLAKRRSLHKIAAIGAPTAVGVCGNGMCESGSGENCVTCYADCGVCASNTT